MGGTRSTTTVGSFQHAASPRGSSILILQSTRLSTTKRKEREWVSRDELCEARGLRAHQSGIEACRDEWFHREARGARPVHDVHARRCRRALGAPSCERAVPIARAHVGASGSPIPMAGWKRLGELYPTMPFGEAMDGGRGGNRYRAGRLLKTDNF